MQNGIQTRSIRRQQIKFKHSRTQEYTGYKKMATGYLQCLILLNYHSKRIEAVVNISQIFNQRLHTSIWEQRPSTTTILIYMQWELKGRGKFQLSELTPTFPSPCTASMATSSSVSSINATITLSTCEAYLAAPDLGICTSETCCKMADYYMHNYLK